MQHAELYVSPTTGTEKRKNAAEAADIQRAFELDATTERSPAELPTKGGGGGMDLPRPHR